MIQVRRTGKPRYLKRQEEKLANCKSDSDREKIYKKYKSKTVLRALESMFHKKCAYCECQIRHVAYPHIEHFRPKANPAYKHLSVNWSNLLLACEVCNKKKGSRFPEASEGGPLVDPTSENPADHLDYVLDLKSRLASIYGKTPRGKTTEALLELNRPDLLEYRSRVLFKLALIKRMSQTDPEAREVWQAIGSDDEFLAFTQAL